MNRRTYLKTLAFLGLTASTSLVQATTRLQDNQHTVIIIGAGAAGMAAGHLLAQQGVDFIILEASNRYGGRLKNDDTFTDFPIPLGAEWLHATPEELKKIVNDRNISITTAIQAYERSDSYHHYDGELEKDTIGKADDLRFVNTNWLNFFEQYLLPNIQASIQLNTEIVDIHYAGDKVIVSDRQGRSLTANKLIVTVPLAILKQKTIRFTPPLPQNKQSALEAADVWSGMKVFIEFTDKFYPSTFLEFPDSYTDEGQRVYYDAAYAQASKKHILGLFVVGKSIEHYQDDHGAFQIDYVLEELDEIYDQLPSSHYVKHTVQQWDHEPFIQGAYLSDHAPSYISSTLNKHIDHKIYFAGDAYTQEDDWSAVHNATRSAAVAVKAIIKALRRL